MRKQSWIFAFALGAALTAVAPAFAAEWWYVGVTKGDAMVYFVDRESVRTSQGGVGRSTVLNAWTMSYAKGSNGKYYKEGMTFRADDCSDSSTMLRQYITYEPDGTISHSSGVIRSEWAFVVPDSIGEAIQKFVCNHTMGAGSVTEFSIGGDSFRYVADPEVLAQ